MYTIRAYEEKDRQRVEAICLSPEKADTGEASGNGGIFSSMLRTVYCRYYVEQEPHNCFVAVNEKDNVVGYILSAVIGVAVMVIVFRLLALAVCWCWTSRPTDWTSAAPTWSSMCCVRSPEPERPCCSPPPRHH